MTIETALAANTNAAPSREFLERQAFEAFKAFVFAFQRLVETPNVEIAPPAPQAPAPQGDTSSSDSQAKDVMTADEVAAFLGVDRNTVYEFASRGVIPHQRLGKRLLFRRGAVVAWLDTSLCNATTARSA